MIPKPHYKLDKYPNYKLRAVYPWSEGRLEALREAIHSASMEHLVVHKPPSFQNIEKWKKFRQQVARAIPELEEFEDYWPIHPLLTKIRRHKRNMMRKRRKTNAVRRPRLSAFIGKPLPRRVLFQMGATTAPYHSAENGSTHIAAMVASNIRPSPSHRPTQLTQFTGRSNGCVTSRRPPSFIDLISNGSREQPVSPRRPTQVPQLHTNGNIQQMTHQLGRTSIGGGLEERLAIDAGCVVCLFCDYYPDIPASAKAHIQVFSQNKVVVDALARLGIVNDKHLSILHHLTAWNAGPEQFMDSLSEGMLSPLHKFSLLQHFEKHFMPKDLTSVSRNVNCWSGCPNHSRGNNDIDRVPPKLGRLLEKFGMEELAPVFHAGHVTSDDEFDLLHALDETPRLAIFSGEQFRRMKSFQFWMLKFILLHIHTLD